jgi:hypothetical protein
MVFQAYLECRKELFSLKKGLKFLSDNRTLMNDELYNTFSNGNVIILGTLFESFIENIIQEYIDEIIKGFNTRKISFKKIPNATQSYICKNLLRKNHRQSFDQIHFEQAEQMFKKFILSLEDNIFLIDDELDYINKFTFGKHGETEVKKVFKRLGINIEENFDSFTELNNFFALRNNIVHPESLSLTRNSPPTREQTERYIKLFFVFIRKIDMQLKKELTKLLSQ